MSFTRSESQSVCASCSAANGAPLAKFNKSSGFEVLAGNCLTNHAKPNPVGGLENLMCWQRLKIVAGKCEACSLIKMRMAPDEGSSRVFNNAFAAFAFILLAGLINTNRY